ncbi:MAG: 2-amino-4-hydroxy-6-hydroxymethyldihydropteridine diphosphokinase [Burkholderiaceae bacterium]
MSADATNRAADRKTVTAYIGVGANLGFSRDAVLNAIVDLSGLPMTEFVASSSLYRSSPIDGEGPDYINAVAEITTRQSAHALLLALQAIETRYGRVRTTRNAPRTLDLDLLLYGDGILKTPDLTVPHPRIAERAFVLLPLMELAGPIAIPGHGPADVLAARVSGQEIDRLEP